ncbi:DUF4244 domain-containing protein [Curtobacterium ammoniigenes]|uniref:DUF4244 domain-containing protein n=1 Tax=Curtobacterium ammoniigenes TaxID=395387 RepID=UPI0009FB327B|nr:DUF4244 domain-containing protein [Curtobacterium ammoniigenes]
MPSAAILGSLRSSAPAAAKPYVWRPDQGSVTAEYAIVILAAVAFAGVLVAVMRSGEIQQILTDLVRGALAQ